MMREIYIGTDFAGLRACIRIQAICAAHKQATCPGFAQRKGVPATSCLHGLPDRPCGLAAERLTVGEAAADPAPPAAQKTGGEHDR